MEKQEFLNRITEIGACEDDVQRREMLTLLADDATKVYDNLTNLIETNKNLTTDNETLRSANMRLFLRVGEERNITDTHKEQTGVAMKQPEKRSFDDLFNEKGGLK